MKLKMVTMSAIFATLILSTQAPLLAYQNAATETVNLVCGRDDDQDTYYSELALNESNGSAVFARRSSGRTIGPDRMNALFTPTEVQFEKIITRRPEMREVFRLSRVDLSLTRWFEASFSNSEPTTSVEQCAILEVPAERAF